MICMVKAYETEKDEMKVYNELLVSSKPFFIRAKKKRGGSRTEIRP